MPSPSSLFHPAPTSAPDAWCRTVCRCRSTSRRLLPRRSIPATRSGPPVLCRGTGPPAPATAQSTSHHRSLHVSLWQRIVRVVMSGDNDDPVFAARELCNDVVDGKLAHRSLRGKFIFLDVNALEFRKNILLQLGVSRTAHRPRTDRDNLLDVLHDVVAVHVWLGDGAGGIRRHWTRRGSRHRIRRRRRLDLSRRLRRCLLLVTSQGDCCDRNEQTNSE